MGQAFDRDGNVLGEAFGDTKQEVFNKLAEQFKDAAEIRIRTMTNQLEGASVQMPKYRCHKEVWALKIKQINEMNGGGAIHMLITPEDSAYAPFYVDASYVKKHQPKVGGYYVVYQDGYKSFSPADAFEEG